jgi:hypothetical protein
MKALARCVVDAMAFLEFSDFEKLGDDEAIQAMEMLASNLAETTSAERDALRAVLAEELKARESAGRMTDEQRLFFENFFEACGIEDA